MRKPPAQFAPLAAASFPSSSWPLTAVRTAARPAPRCCWLAVALLCAGACEDGFAFEGNGARIAVLELRVQALAKQLEQTRTPAASLSPSPPQAPANGMAWQRHDDPLQQPGQLAAAQPGPVLAADSKPRGGKRSRTLTAVSAQAAEPRLAAFDAPARDPAAGAARSTTGATRGAVGPAATTGVLPPLAAGEFDVECPPPWQLLPAGGGVAWACRAERPSSDGLWPNCNVTSGQAPAGLSLKTYLDQSLASVPQLKAARRLADRAGTLGGAPAHEALYDHDLLGRPLRVLATIGSLEGTIYALNCSAAPQAYAAQEARFRRIVRSFRVQP
jgi:hypothetical protein